jgi:hypothetical protein
MTFLDQAAVDTTEAVVSSSIATLVTSALIPCGSVLTLSGYTRGPSSYACTGSVAGAVDIAALCCFSPPGSSPSDPPSPLVQVGVCQGRHGDSWYMGLQPHQPYWHV